MSPQYLYSPWRLDYILGEKPEDCVLCRFQQQDKDIENLIVHRGQFAYVMLNRYPYNNGHLMIVPYVHKSSLNDLSAECLAEMMNLAQLCENIFKQSYNCEGINLGMNLGKAAGAGIDEHLHLHMVPRWMSDHNFMSVIGGQRVIPEPFELSYQRFAEAFAQRIKG